MRKSVLLGLAVLALATAVGFGQGGDAASQPTDYTLTVPRATALKTTSYVYQTVQTTLRTSGDPIANIMKDLTLKMKSGQFMPNGGPIFVYKTTPKGMDDIIEMQIGMPTNAKTAPDGYEVRDLDSSSVVTSLFQGPMSALSKAYPSFFEQMMKGGNIPSGELRERIIYWEDATSSNNVLIIEVGTKSTP